MDTLPRAQQLLTEDGPFASDTITNVYWSRMRTNLSLAQPTGVWTNAFVYSATHRLYSVTSPAGTFIYNYAEPSTRLTSLSLPNGAYVNNIYDTMSRLTNSFLYGSAGALDGHVYQYDGENQRTNEIRADSSTVAYSYDNIGQLKIANSSVPAEDCGYFYDAAWNLNRRTNNGVTGTFTVDNKNELTNAPVGATLSYDSNGNLLTYQTGHDNKSYAYDDENRLVDWQDAKSGLETVLIYDGMGRLRVRQEYQNLGSSPLVTGTLVSETHYIYDGWRVIQERDGANTPTASYTRGNDLSVSLEGAGGIGGLLARSDGYSSGNWTSNECYYADGNGNVTSLTDGNQAVVAGYRYDPFGNIVSKSGTLADANVYRFSSKEIHVNSGMHYYGFRFYDPSLQRWINRDPIGEQGGLNLYGYARNNPVSIVDPKGLCPPSDAYSLMGMGGESMAPFANPAGVQSLANAGAAAQQAGFPSDKVVSAAGDASFNDAMRLTSPVSLSGGLQLSGAATAAPTLFGGHAEGAFGLGLFPSGPGGFASHGESIGPAGLVSPQNPDDKISLNPAWGSFIGGGPGAWLSNAQCPSDLQNTVQNLSFNIGLFDFGFGASLSWGNGIWQATFSPPTPISLGAGIDLSLQRTTTVGF